MSDTQSTTIPTTRYDPFGSEIKTHEEATFIPNRVFVHQLDSYHGKQISKILSDKLFMARDEEVDEGEGEEKLEEERPTEKLDQLGDQLKYEIIGTVKHGYYQQTEDIEMIVNESNQEQFPKELLRSKFVIYDITTDSDVIPKARQALEMIEKMLDELNEAAPKRFQNMNEQRVFVLITTIMTWAKTKPIDPDEPDVPFVENDFRKRKTHPNYKAHIELEKDVIKKGKKYKDKLLTIVIATGLTYGDEEEDLHFLFKLAWNNEPELPLIVPGTNTVPLLNVKDLVSVLYALFESLPNKSKYILAVEQTMTTQRQIVKALSKTMGTGRIKIVSKEDSFLYSEMTQQFHEKLTVNLKMEPNYIVNDLDIPWQSDMSFPENINKIINEYKTARKLKSIKIILHGPPGVGKTELAKQICDIYGLHYISIPTLIKETLESLRVDIEYAKAQLKAKEGKAADEADEENEEEEEEEEEEDFAEKIEEMQERIKEIEIGLEQGENGRLSDSLIIELVKTKLKSNACHNQGYVLDGYPKTSEQTKELFDIGGEEGEAEEEEDMEEESGATPKQSILPDYVITLEASDNFLYDRIMSLPEQTLAGTHYTEKHMVRRLAEFRARNTDDNTMLNLFDEIEIHPIVIDAETEDKDAVYELIKEKIGPPVGYPLLPWQLERLRLEEEVLRLEQEEEARRAKEEMERKAKELKEKNMETWIDMLQALQNEEQQILMAQCKPLRDYLIKFVFPTLTRALVETARIRPDDPVDFLAEYLFKENPEGRMFDPSYVNEADNMLKTIEEFQAQILPNT